MGIGKVGIDKWEVDQMGIDKVGIEEVGINLLAEVALPVQLVRPWSQHFS